MFQAGSAKVDNWLENSCISETLTNLVADLNAEWRSPERCHLAGIIWLWQAIEATEHGDLITAAECWELAVPHLVFSFNSDKYMAKFAAARGMIYGEGLNPSQCAEGVKMTIAFIETRLKELAERAKEAVDEQLAQRLESLYLRWCLEWEAAVRIRRLGGVPDGQKPARGVVIGPMFAARYGLQDSVKNHLITDRSDFHQIFAQITGSSSNTQREALYCFTDLAMPFAYHQAGKHGVALSLLKALTTSDDQVRNHATPNSAAVELRARARDLAIRIHHGLGNEELRRLHCDPDIVYDHFQAALSEARFTDIHFASAATEPIIKEVNDRICHLKDSNDWDRAVRLGKMLAKINPTMEQLSYLVSLLMEQAIWSADRENGLIISFDCLNRAQMLSPKNEQVRMLLLHLYGKHLHDLQEKNQHGESVQCCMAVLDEVRNIEVAAEKQILTDPDLLELATRAKSHSAYILINSIEALGDNIDERLLAVAKAYIVDAIQGRIPEISAAGASRLANQAIKLAGEEQWSAAYANIEKAYEMQPDEPQLRLLFEGMASAIIINLCDLGDIDRAEEIAESVSQRLPDSNAISRAHARILLKRLDIGRLTSMDPEDITALITMVESRISRTDDMERPKDKGNQYAAIIDPELRVERHLINVSQLLDFGKTATALVLLDEEQYNGFDKARAGYFRSRALRFSGRPEEALEVINLLLQEFPLLMALHKERASALSQSGRFGEAEDLLMACRESAEPGSYEEYMVNELGMNAWRAGHYEDAIAQMRLARETGFPSLSGWWIECIALKRLGRNSEIPQTVEAALQNEGITSWEKMLTHCLGGAVSDEILRAAPVTPAEKLEQKYWLGEKERAFGDAAVGCELIRSCLDDTSLAHHYEFQHAQALFLSGQL